MGRNLTNLYISESFQYLLQTSGSEIQNGLGNKIIGSLDITASLANNAINATSATSASYASTSVSSSYSTTALSSSYAATATSASHAINANTAVSATSASYALTASYAVNTNIINTGSFLVSASNVVAPSNILFTKGDSSTFNLVINNVSSASYADSSSLAQNIIPGLSPTFTNTTVTNNLTVNGTASIAVLNYVTGSATYIGDSFVVVNTDLPAQRYAGLAVFDSGSSPQVSASLEWDGQNDIWILKEETGNTSVVLTGPTGSKGSEVYTTLNKLQKGLGWNYVGDSSITDDGTKVTISTGLVVTGSIVVTGSNITLAQGSNLITHNVKAAAVNGVEISNNTGGVVALFGAGGSLGTTFYGQINGTVFNGTASLSTTSSYSNTALSSSYALTAFQAERSATASYVDLSAINQNVVFSGSVRGQVSALSISSNTASLDLATENFFTLTLVSGSNTFINPSNIKPGQTINLRITQANPGNGTVSFPSSVKQVSGSAYVPTAGAGPVDIVTLISFDSTQLYLSNVKNLV